MSNIIKYDHDLTKELYKPMPPEAAEFARYYDCHESVVKTTVSMYSDYRVAVKELVDNSLDADADQVDLIIGYESAGSPFFAIHDNGNGMGQRQYSGELFFAGLD